MPGSSIRGNAGRFTTDSHSIGSPTHETARLGAHHSRRGNNRKNDDDLIAIGSQAILGQFPDAPGELLVSNEADVYPRTYPDRVDLIDSTIGQGSPFQRAFGYYAHGVGEETAILPDGWQDRLILVTGESTRAIRGWCLEVHDLPIAKYAAGREKDLDFTAALVRHGMVSREELDRRLTATALDPQLRPLITRRIDADFKR